MKRAHESVNEPDIVALRNLEAAEEILSQLDGMEHHRENVTNVRSELGSELLENAVQDATQVAEEGMNELPEHLEPDGE